MMAKLGSDNGRRKGERLRMRMSATKYSFAHGDPAHASSIHSPCSIRRKQVGGRVVYKISLFLFYMIMR